MSKPERRMLCRNLVTGPRLVFMDAPSGGRDVSVQARLLDLLRGLVRAMGLRAIIVTHDLAVVRPLADWLMVRQAASPIRCWMVRNPAKPNGSCPACFRSEKGKPMIQIDALLNGFTLHNQGGAVIRVMERANLSAAAAGSILVGDTDVAKAVPRAPTVNVVAEPLRARGSPSEAARHRAEERLAHLTIPQKLWSLSRTTFSAAAQQRVNLAHGFVHDAPPLLPDEPKARLNATNRDIDVSHGTGARAT